MVTFTTADQSEEDGNRIELYEFRAGDVFYRYHNGQQVLSHLGYDWAPEQIRRGRSSVNQDKLRNNTKVSLPIKNAFASAFIGQAVEQDVTVKILQIHLGASGDRVVWTGRITKSTASETEVEFNCQSTLSILAREGLRATFERGCRHNVYRGGCRLVRDDWETTVTGVTESSDQLSASEFGNQPDGWWSGGAVESSNGEKRLVINHVGSIITLSRPFVASVNGSTVKIVPGCDRTLPTCNSKFSNADNFGGQWYMPTKNPFEGLG